MKTGIIIIFIFSWLISATGQIKAQDWKVSTYSVSFSIKHAMGSTATGTFKNLQAELKFSPDKLSEAKINASVDASTFNTGTAARDKNLKGEEYFDVTKYPKISMKLLRVKSAGGNSYSGVFALTIKNVTKEITVPFTFVVKENTASFVGNFTVNRLDFNVGESSWLLGDEATLKVVVNVIQ